MQEPARVESGASRPPFQRAQDGPQLQQIYVFCSFPLPRLGYLPCPSSRVHCCPDDGIGPIGHTQVQPDVRAPELHPAQVLVDQPDPNMLGSLSFPWWAQSLNHSARLSDISRAITASSSSKTSPSSLSFDPVTSSNP